MESPGGIVLARVFGVPVVVRPSWLLVALVITWAFGPLLADAVPGLGPWAYAASAAFTLLLYASVLLHELGHVLVARAFGLPVRRVELSLFGGGSHLGVALPDPRREAAVAAAGPALSLLLAGIGLVAGRAAPDGTVLRVLVQHVAAANLLIALVNLLPGLPLDGGRVLTAAVWRATGRRSAGARASAWGGRAVAGLALAAPVAVDAAVDGPVGPLSVLLGLALGLPLWLAASAALEAARVSERIPGLSAARLAQPAVSVPPATPLSEALRRAAEAGARAVVVVAPDGRPLALAAEERLSRVPDARRPWTAVADASHRLEAGAEIRSDLTGEDLLSALHNAPAPEYLVLTPDGKVSGVLAARDVSRALGRPA
ncbi:site-2 protease family protein [Motilibacter aurantiacus]|uniref:site-2 protease family protein n=1 Tax=Motilibacter aurantiacus TaxID=2714955 RepID=UPI00140DED2F|nr:site-2 protease family protein [Motilibacter aurantiacus]